MLWHLSIKANKVERADTNNTVVFYYTKTDEPNLYNANVSGQEDQINFIRGCIIRIWRLRDEKTKGEEKIPLLIRCDELLENEKLEIFVNDDIA